MFKVANKKDFPLLNGQKPNEGLVYLDSAATSQKPQAVIDAITEFYSQHNANVHRGIYELSERAANMYEDARAKVAGFIGAPRKEEVIFTRNVTEGLNMVAFGWAAQNLQKGDVILVVEADHHSNLVPWQMAAKRVGAKVEALTVDENGELSMDLVKEKLSNKVRLVAISHASNVLGTIFPVKEICKLVKEAGAIVCVDGAQAVPHLPVNVQSLGCDFYSFSGHKMLAPMGIGVLWGRKELLDKMQPFEFGGGMIDEVSVEKATWGPIPERFEAGTPNVEGAIGLAAAIDYLENIGMENVRNHEVELTKYALEKLGKVEGLKILGPLDAEKRTGLVSFVMSATSELSPSEASRSEKIHPHDIAAILGEKGVAVRSGQHCTMPLHDKLGITASVRASFYIYNSPEDIDKLVTALSEAKELLT